MFVLATVAYLALLTTSEQTSTCSTSNGMTKELRQAIVDEHNKYRSQVARGLAANPATGGNAPKAARMFKMEYDCSIEDKMVGWLQQCTWGHSPKTNRPGLGENLWMASPVAGNKTESLIRAVADWFAELKEKGVPTANKLTMDVFNRGVGHYTQLVWEKSDRIGCGIRDCPSSRMTYVGCEYKPGGNMLNEYIYKVGDPCTKNEDCGCNNCTCSTTEALCIRPDSTPMPDEVNSQSQQEQNNWFTLPKGFGFMNSENQQQKDDDWFSGFGRMNSQYQQRKDNLLSGFGRINSKNQQQRDDWFSGFGRMNFQNQQEKDDWFSRPLGFSRINSQNQQGNHKWISEPQGNGWKWSYSWSS